MVRIATIGLGLGLGLAAGMAQADTYTFAVDPARSGLSFIVDNGVHIEGSLIGNYDAQNNPGGTKTRNGLFGGNDNEPVALTTDATVAGDGQTSPSGGFTFTLFPDQMTMSVSGLGLDLLGGASPTLPLTVALDFNTFRTYNPDSLYLGGILPPIEVGEAVLSILSAAQSGPGGGALTPSGENRFDFEAVVEASVTLQMSVLGQEVAPGPQPAPLALAGTITLGENGEATVVMTLDQQIQQDIPLDNVVLEDVPVDLPTILPPGYTAHLLLGGEVQTVSLDMTLNLTVVGDGALACPADFDGDGVLDIFDFLAFQNAFNAKDPRADFNGDGAFDLFDFLAFVNAFGEGC